MEDTAHESSVLPRLELGGRGSEADDVVPFADSIELLSKSGLPESALIGTTGWLIRSRWRPFCGLSRLARTRPGQCTAYPFQVLSLQPGPQTL